MKKDVFCLVTSMGQNKKFWVPMRNWTSDLWIPHCDALPLSQNRSRESESLRFDCWDITMGIWWLSDLCSDALPLSWNWSMESEGPSFNSSWELRIFSLSNARDKTKNIFLYFFTELKTYHLSYFIYKLSDTCLLIGSFLWSIGNKCIDDLTIEKFFFSLSYNTNRFHVAMDLFSSRSQKTITCDYNISDTFSFTLFTTFLFLLYFDLNCDLYLNRFMVPWNLFVNYNREFGCLTPD